MCRITPTAVLLLAACAPRPAPAPTPARPAPPALPAEKPQTGSLIGLSANELAARFGPPKLQIREGAGTKLQFTAPSCVLDAYLYPPGSGSGGLPRVTHVDTRDRMGRDVDQLGCIAAIEAR